MKRKKNIKKIIIILIILLLLFFAAFLINKVYEKKLKENVKDVSWLRKNISITEDYMIGSKVLSVNKVDEVDIYSEEYRTVISEKINELLENEYSFENPLLIYNAYGTNNSSINIYFKSDEKSYLTYTIKCTDSDIDDYTKTLYNEGENNLTTDHKYQITGLVAGKNQEIILKLYDEDNQKIDEKKLSVYMPESDIDISLATTNGSSNSELEDGLYAILGHDKSFNSNIYLYDNDGILRGEIPLNSYRTDRIIKIKDNILYSYTKRNFALVNRLGQVIGTYKIDGYYMHHDFIYDEENNNLIILANKDDDNTIEDRVITLNLDTGETKEIINMQNFAKDFYETAVQPEGGNTYGGDELDWIHLNSLSLDGDKLFLSSREFSTIFCIDNIYDEPTLNYVIGDESIYKDTSLENYALKKVGDFISQAGQHSITYVYDDTLLSGQYYLIMYNNNYAASRTRPDFNWEPFVGAGDYNNGSASKYYKYLVDENNKTFTLVDSFDTDYSSIVSNVQEYKNNVITSSGMDNSFSEYDSEHNLIKKFSYSSKKYAYRVFKYDFNNFWYY